MTGWRLVLNLGGYQAGWLAAVYGATHALPLLGPVVAAILVGIHLLLSVHPLRSAGLVAIVLLFGILQESAMFRLGLIAYPGNPQTVPAWMLALWPLFATTLSVALRWFQTRLPIAALAGAVLGPLAYWAGAAAGAIALPEPALSLVCLGIAWMAALPLLLVLARRLEPGRVD